MVLIKDAMLQILDDGKKNTPILTKYAISKRIGVRPIMIDRYLDGSVRSPQKRICVSVFKEYGIVLSPYSKEELIEELNKGKEDE